jgi:phage/plasmid-like protein (TIGR03299 family)
MPTEAAHRVPFTKFVTPVAQEYEKDPMGALAAAGLDYEVTKRPLYFASTVPSKKSKPIKIPDRYATVKMFDGDEAYIANVGPRYEEIQNRDAFGVSQALVDVGFLVHSVGESKDSKRVFMNLRAPDGFEVLGGEDHHELFVMVRTSHDGTLTLQGLITPVRIFCQNQMRLIESTAVDRWRFRHLAGAELAFEAETMAKLCVDYVSSYQDVAAKLAAIDLELDATKKILEKAMPKRTEWHDGILNALENSPTIDSEHRRTGWGLVNATTEYLEWLREVKTDEARFSATVDGAALRATRKVLRQLTR